MISINQLSVDFGTFLLFDDVTFLINPKDRIGLVGKNGAGKSTLLKMIAGQMKPTSGSIACPRDLIIGYLPQTMPHLDTLTVRQEAALAFKSMIAMEKEMERLTREIETTDNHESESYMEMLHKLTEISDRYNILGGSRYESQIEVTLKGLGFKNSDLDRQTSEFSGGWRMRVELAKTLLQRPDVLLLDEPTNHLDIESIQWFEEFLKSYGGAVVLVSHDRAFLDNITRRTIEISLGKIYDYKASYSRFVQLRQERREQQMAAYRNQQKTIDDIETFIERFRYKASKAVQVQSRIKQLDKIDRIEVDELDSSSMRIKFAPAPHSGVTTVKGTSVSKFFGSHHVLDEIDFVIPRGEKVAFVGKNGEGKTTLVRILLNEIEYSGQIVLGHNVKIGYFSQNQADKLDERLTVLETVDRVAVGDARPKIRELLGAFLFGGDTVDKKVAVLSGGERTRLALVKLLLEPFNFLILDEPTNHLDMRSKDLLKKALTDFGGTVLIVSHDRDFLKDLVTKTFEFSNRKVKEYLGGIYYFLEKKKLDSLQQLETPKLKRQPEEVKKEEPRERLNFGERKDLNRQLKKVSGEVEAIEAEIAKLENRVSEIDRLLANPNGHQGIETLYEEHGKVRADLQNSMARWEDLTLKLELLKESMAGI